MYLLRHDTTDHTYHTDPVFTPFYPNGSLYLDAIPHYAKYTAESGTHTIILGGSTGEWPSLTSVERVQVLQAWRDAVDNLPASSLPLGRRYGQDRCLIRFSCALVVCD